jgi:egghead protein (zeste-white 4 protein)
VTSTVAFRIVCRGQNADALRATVASVRDAVAEQPLFPYRIEVVSDIPVQIDPGRDLVQYVVPDDYQTPNQSKYKARALEYALWHSGLADDAWLMHLDEESHLTASVVRGIAVAVREEEASGQLRIGQGAILYHRDLEGEKFLTLADAIRTGDDLGRFHFQHRVGETIFGLHGSFILVRNDVEKEVGFDFGPKGSITEDAFWAVVQMQNGRRCRWVDGFIVEQATRSLADFIKQRRRWFVGLMLVALYAPVRMRYRAAIGVSTVMWSVSWVGVLATYVNLVAGITVPLPIRLAGNAAFAFYVMLYFIGIRLQLDYGGPLGLLHRLGHYVGVVVLIPVFAILESLGVIYGLLRPDVGGFHVVKK